MTVRTWHRGLPIAAGLAFACLAGLALPSERAEAAPGGRAPLATGAGAQVTMDLRGSKEFSAGVEGAGGRVRLSIVIGKSGATYTVPGRVWRGGVRATFGNLGRIAVRFKPSGREKIEKPPRGCRGRPRRTRFGTYVGVVSFTGEGGYARISLRRARGTNSSTPRWRCGRGGAARAGASPVGKGSAALEAATAKKGLTLSAVAAPALFGVRLAIVSAQLNERRGNMRISRFALLFMARSRFTFDKTLAMATLAPPSPFAGSATFERQADGSASWTGDLRVSLPGADEVPLTGERFTRLRLFPL